LIAGLRDRRCGPRFRPARCRAQYLGRLRMAWKAPKIVEVSVGMEINMYACASRK
jgi:coenzyme PQQ precursor peptide PqqA